MQDPIGPDFVRMEFKAPVDHRTLFFYHLVEQTGNAPTDSKVSAKRLKNFNCTYTKIQKISDICKYITDYQCFIMLKRSV